MNGIKSIKSINSIDSRSYELFSNEYYNLQFVSAEHTLSHNAKI